MSVWYKVIHTETFIIINEVIMGLAMQIQMTKNDRNKWIPPFKRIDEKYLFNYANKNRADKLIFLNIFKPII